MEPMCTRFWPVLILSPVLICALVESAKKAATHSLRVVGNSIFVDGSVLFAFQCAFVRLYAGECVEVLCFTADGYCDHWWVRSRVRCALVEHAGKA